MRKRPDGPFVRKGLDIRLVARRQRWLLWLILANLASMLLPMLLGVTMVRLGGAIGLVSFMVVIYILRLAAWVGTILLMIALRTHIVLVVLCALLMFLPLVNLIILLLENRRATRVLQDVGLRVGLMGVRDEAVVRQLSLNLCHTCGYDLTGNVSGRCPECGTWISEPEAADPAGFRAPA